jgi:hypothetical protein
MRWSVTFEASGDRELTREEIVELADGVAAANGVASGIGTSTYGAQLYVEADDRADAIDRARAVFDAAVAQAALPPWPLSRTVALSEAEDLAEAENGWVEFG